MKNDGHVGYIRQKKSWGGCHHLLSVYDASNLSAVYVVKSPVLGLQRAFFRKVRIFFKSENLKKMFLIMIDGLIGFI